MQAQVRQNSAGRGEVSTESHPWLKSSYQLIVLGRGRTNFPFFDVKSPILIEKLCRRNHGDFPRAIYTEIQHTQKNRYAMHLPAN